MPAAAGAAPAAAPAAAGKGAPAPVKGKRGRAGKAEAEALLQAEILKALEGVEGQVMLKLSLPTVPDFYLPLVRHPKVLKVVALSGELSQSERMHALQALRDGRARVCIATDVAARGIDLPGLELVTDKTVTIDGA